VGRARVNTVSGLTTNTGFALPGEAETRTRLMSLIIIVNEVSKMSRRAPIHPGRVLRHEFLEELGVTSYSLAKSIGVPTNRVTGIVNGDRAISADTALRFACFFGNSAEFWMNLQMHYDLEVANRRSGIVIKKNIQQVLVVPV
jgi:addiction module HigA family antidote